MVDHRTMAWLMVEPSWDGIGSWFSVRRDLGAIALPIESQKHLVIHQVGGFLTAGPPMIAGPWSTICLLRWCMGLVVGRLYLVVQ